MSAHPATSRVWGAATRGVLASEWTDGALKRSRVEEFSSIESALGQQDVTIYGTNTAVGEADGRVLSDESGAGFQVDLIENHAAAADSRDERASPLVGRLAIAAKVEQAHRGGTGLSEPLYQRLLSCIVDSGFAPLIPLDSSSYSCGDVVPGASLARAVLDGMQESDLARLLYPGGGLALINGTHIQSAASLDVLSLMSSVGVLARRSAHLALRAHGVGRSEAEAWVAVLRESEAPVIEGYVKTDPPDLPTPARQRPVSVRAIPSTMEALTLSRERLIKAVELSLRPSGNPLFAKRSGQFTSVSQATFLDLPLTLAVADVTASVLSLGWASERRLQHASTALLNARPSDGLGLMQYAKVATAILERARAACSRRPFSAGGETASGIEDFWTFGLQECLWARTALEAVEQVLLREASATMVLCWISGTTPIPTGLADSPMHEAVRAAESEISSAVEPMRASAELLEDL